MSERRQPRPKINHSTRSDPDFVSMVREKIITRGFKSSYMVKQTSDGRVLQKLKPGQIIV